MIEYETNYRDSSKGMHMIAVLLYLIMALFDLSILAGTVYMVEWRGWSTWWMVLAISLCSVSAPLTILKILKDKS